MQGSAHSAWQWSGATAFSTNWSQLAFSQPLATILLCIVKYLFIPQTALSGTQSGITLAYMQRYCSVIVLTSWWHHASASVTSCEQFRLTHWISGGWKTQWAKYNYEWEWVKYNCEWGPNDLVVWEFAQPRDCATHSQNPEIPFQSQDCATNPEIA